jgi:tetratricopeptide (TPR) repeat protein
VFRVPRLLLLPSLLLLLGLAAAAPAPNQPPTQDEAITLLNAGKRQDALRMLNGIIASHPADPTPALYTAAAIDLQDGNWQDAKPLIEQMTRLRPSSFEGWELAIQAEQAAGDQQQRDAAIKALYVAWRSTPDRDIQSKVAFVRDRIFGPRHTLLAGQMLDPGGDNIVRFVFQPADEPAEPTHSIVVASDNDTNERWRQDGTVPYGTLVYHLDTIERLANGSAAVRPYAFYVEEPSYDRVRAKVVEILAGTVQPLSGAADPYWAGDQ